MLRPQSWSAMKSSLNCVSFSIFQEKISQSNKKPGSSESLYCIRWLHWRYSLYLDIKNGFNYVKKDSVLRYNKDIPQCPRQWVRWEQEILGASNFLDTIHWLSWFLHESLSNFPLVPGLVSDSQLIYWAKLLLGFHIRAVLWALVDMSQWHYVFKPTLGHFQLSNDSGPAEDLGLLWPASLSCLREQKLFS